MQVIKFNQKCPSCKKVTVYKMFFHVVWCTNCGTKENLPYENLERLNKTREGFSSQQDNEQHNWKEAH